MVFINSAEAMKLFKKHNRAITRPGLIELGIKRGFAKKAIDNYHWKFNKKKILEYLELCNCDGYLTVSELSKKLKIPWYTLYKIIRNNTFENYRKKGNAYAYKEEEIKEAYKRFKGNFYHNNNYR